MENAGEFSEMALDRTSTTGGYERPQAIHVIALPRNL